MRSLQSAQAFDVYTLYCIQLPLYTNIVREWARVDSQGMGVCMRRCLSLERTYVFGAASMFVDAIDLRKIEIKVDMPNKIE